MTKLKNLSTLAVITLIIAMVAVSCNNQTPTAAAAIEGGEPAQGFDNNLDINPSVDFTQFIGKTFRSKEAISPDKIIGYLWAEVTDTGLKYGQGGYEAVPTLNKEYPLTANAIQKNVANFTGYDDNNNSQQGTVTFNTDGSLVIKFTIGTSYNGQDIITLQVLKE